MDRPIKDWLNCYSWGNPPPEEPNFTDELASLPAPEEKSEPEPGSISWLYDHEVGGEG